MPYVIPARINKNGKAVPEIIVDDEFKDVVDGMIVLLQGGGNYPSVRINGKITRLHRHLWPSSTDRAQKSLTTSTVM